MDNFIQFYNENLDKNIEFEITYHLNKSNNLFKTIFNKLVDLSDNITIIEHIDIYYDNNVRLTKQFKEGTNMNQDIKIKKKSIFKSIKLEEIINGVKFINIKLNDEQNIKILGSSIIKKIRIKLRIKFTLKNNNNFTIDLDLIKNFNIKNNNLKEIKDSIFRPYKISNIIENINYSLFDEMILETEFISKNINQEIIDNSIIFIKNLFDTDINIDNDYQKYIYKIAKYIISNKVYLENFKHKSGLKKLLNNVIELNSDIFCKKILPNIENYYITDKIDGKRCICYITEYLDKIDIKLVADKLYQISEYNNIFNKNDVHDFKITILDCEVIINYNENNNLLSENDINLYIFDIITYENNNLGFKPFENRFEFLEKGFNKIKFLPNIQIKEYIKLTSDYKKQFIDFYNKKLNNKFYDIDGLIFAPTSKALTSDTKYSINTNYNNMIGYKWKPIEHMTIDFYMCILPKHLYSFYPYKNITLKPNEQIYILFSGISKQDFDKLNFNYITDYKKIVPEQYLNNSYFPIQFSTSDNPYNYIYTSNIDNLNNKIGEFLYNTELKKWTLKKIRTDRDIELARGEYFGNYYRIAELIWNNINNPLDLTNLLDESQCYFVTDDNILYKAQRAFNSYVKTKTLENIISNKLIDKNDTNWVIDLAAGKGQDLARLNNLNFKNGLFLDNDKNALLELINRKFNLRSFKKQNMKIFTKNIDLLEDNKTIIKELSIFNIEKESVDIIICNFAIHYLLINEEKLLNLIKLLDYYLKPGGRFIFSCFNGYKIFKLLEDTNIWNSYDNNNNLKYSIKKLYNSDKFLNIGQKIDVLLPLSNNKYYTEYLVNLDYVFDVFNNNNFTSELSIPFGNLINDFKNDNSKIYNELSNIDIEYTNLYQMNIIKKKRLNNNIIIKSNINSLFNNMNFINNIIGSNYDDSNLNQLKNINNSNKILLIINTNNISLIHNIISIFDEYNYKNKNIYKKNKNKIYKIVTFNETDVDFNTWYSIYNLYKNDEYNSIIFFNKSFVLNDEYEKILLKTPILPIILDNTNFLTIINQSLLNDIITSEMDIIDYLTKNNIEYLYNIKNDKNMFDNYNITENLEVTTNKLFDFIKL